MACCAVAAYIVYRFLGIQEQLFCSLRPKQRTEIHEKQTPLPPRRWGRTAQKDAQACVLNLGGLTCGSCVTDLQNIIEAVPGVLQASVSLALLRAHVAFTDVVAAETVIDSIRAAGYDASLAPTTAAGDWDEVLPAIQKPSDSRAHETESWSCAFNVSVVASLIVAVGGYMSPVQGSGMTKLIDMVLCLAIAFSLLAGSRIHLETVRSIWYGRKPNMSTLASLGICLALMQALAVASADDEIKESRIYHSALDVIPVLSTSVVGGRLLKSVLSQRSLDFGSPLINLVPTTANVLHGQGGGNEERVPINMVSPGDRLLVHEGDRVPADGIVEGSSPTLVLETWMSGSTTPKAVESGDAVFAGSRVEQGLLVFRAQSCGRSTRLGGMLESVVIAELTSTETLTENLTTYFTTAILILAAAICVGKLWYTPHARWSDILGQASTVLLAACPCALSLSIPTCKLLATVRASKAGVRLTTSYDRMRNAASAGTILFDKTGTLTNGVLQVTHVSLALDWSKTPQRRAMVWNAVQELERGLQHPVADAVIREAKQQMASLGFPPYANIIGELAVSEVSHELGRGVQGIMAIAGSQPTSWTMAIGSRRYIESLGVRVDLVTVPTHLRDDVATPVIIAINGAQAAVLLLQDTIRLDAVSAITSLKKAGIRVGMVTGDNHASAVAVSRQVGIDTDMVFSNCLPQDKADIVNKFRRQDPTIFVGDNLNDIPSFASASFSVCAADADMFLSSNFDLADATLAPIAVGTNVEAPGRLRRILFLIQLSRYTNRIVAQNFWWATVYNIVSLLWASGAFGANYSSSSVGASLGMGFSSVIVLLNSARVEKMRF